MTTKRLLALLIAVFMLVALFSACANTNNDSKTPSDSGSSANTPDDSGTEDKGNDDKDDGKTDDIYISYKEKVRNKIRLSRIFA